MNRGKGTIFPEVTRKKGRRGEDENVLSWGGLNRGLFKSNHFELLKKVKNRVVYSNLHDTGS